MPKLNAEKNTGSVDNSTHKVVKKVRAARLRPASVTQDDNGDAKPKMGYVTYDGSKGVTVDCTNAIYRRIAGPAETNSADSLAMRSTGDYIVGLDKNGVCVRLDVINTLPVLSPGVKADGDPPEGEFYIRYDNSTGSYDVEKCPRGIVFRDVEIMLNLLDKQDEISAGTALNKTLVVSEVSPPFIKVKMPTRKR